MTILELENKWLELSENTITSGFRSIRISAECISDIFVGINKDANRCLILAIPSSYEIDFKSVIKENLTIEYFRDKNLIVLRLTENSYYDLFDDLIISLYQRIKDISLINEYSKEFIQSFYKWSEFFEDKKSELLSENIIKGLFGEILYLKLLIEQSNFTTINETLNSWKGPYDKGHDFEMNNLDIEVKTKDISQQEVKISSEFQLEGSFDKQLELLVVSVENDSKNGLSLKDLLFPIKKSIAELLGDSSILLKALIQKGLTFKNIHQYDIFRFKPISMITYNCLNEGFPKLTKSNIPKEVNSISYNIRLGTLNEFMISKKEF
jgi:hypothetical protein